jgi:NAD(P)H-flavin reductase
MATATKEKKQSQPKSDLYRPMPATLVKIKPMTSTDTFFEVKLDSGKDLGHEPGQFVEVSLPGVGEAPISVSSSPTLKGVFQMVIRRVGNVTTMLHRMKPGGKMGIRGPFGTVFPVDTDLRGKNVLFVGGGIGLVPLRSAIQYVLKFRKNYGRVVILSGTKCSSDRLFTDELSEWAKREDVEFLETVDQGSPDWKGNVGLITTLFPKVAMGSDPWSAVICGPPIMYKFVIRELRRLQVPNQNIFVSLERRMKCGVGKCGHCQMNGVYVCQEGPVFRYKDILDVQEAI